MGSTGWVLPNNGTNTAASGNAWADPTGITAFGTPAAVATVPASDSSDSLDAAYDHIDTRIPTYVTSSTFRGVALVLPKRSSGDGGAEDENIRFRAGGANVGSLLTGNGSAVGAWTADDHFGGFGNKLGLTLANLQSATFLLRVSAAEINGTDEVILSLDYELLNVFFDGNRRRRYARRVARR